MMTTTARQRAAILKALPRLSGALGGETACDPESAPPRLPPSAANITDHWLCVEFALPEPLTGGARAWDLLAHSGTWPGVKFVARRSGGKIMAALRGELPLIDDEARLLQRLDGMFRDLRAAWETGVLHPARRPTPDAGAPLNVPELGELCAEAGWPVVPGEASAVSVRLEGLRFGCQARFWPAGADMTLTAEWATLEAQLAPDVELALGAYLLAVSGASRLAAVGCLGTGEDCPRIVGPRAVLPRDASAEEIGHTLAALAVASRMCGPEVALLQEDHDLARAWMCGCSDIVPRF